jgi:hypothetical protein
MTTPAPASTAWLNIEIDHSQYYRWVPIAEADVYDDSAEGADPAPDGQTPRSKTVDSSFPGFRMARIVVDEPTTSTCQVNVPGVQQWNDDRAVAGLSRRTDALNLIQHLSDGPWPKQFPLDSITAIRADNPTWESQLASAFVSSASAADPAPFLGGNQ